MKFEQSHPEPTYVIRGKDFKPIKLNRDEILEKAALILENDPQFPDHRGIKIDQLKASQAIRVVLKELGAGAIFMEDHRSQIQSDASEVLALFKSK